MRSVGAWDESALSLAAALFVITCATFVAIGLLTPAPQVVVVLLQGAMFAATWWAPASLELLREPWQARVCEIGIAVSLALTGPGAYSLDARLFGRHEISIPPRVRASQ